MKLYIRDPFVFALILFRVLLLRFVVRDSGQACGKRCLARLVARYLVEYPVGYLTGYLERCLLGYMLGYLVSCLVGYVVGYVAGVFVEYPLGYCSISGRISRRESLCFCGWISGWIFGSLCRWLSDRDFCI